jgi:hypothetical protein
LNFVTLRPLRDILDDLKAVLKSLYGPAAYFGRVRKSCRVLNRPEHARKISIKEVLRYLRGVGRIAWYMTVQKPGLRRQFWTTLIGSLRYGFGSLECVWIMSAVYMHVGTFANFVIEDLERQIEMIDTKGSRDAAVIAAPAARSA